MLKSRVKKWKKIEKYNKKKFFTTTLWVLLNKPVRANTIYTICISHNQIYPSWLISSVKHKTQI